MSLVSVCRRYRVVGIGVSSVSCVHVLKALDCSLSNRLNYDVPHLPCLLRICLKVLLQKVGEFLLCIHVRKIVSAFAFNSLFSFLFLS